MTGWRTVAMALALGLLAGCGRPPAEVAHGGLHAVSAELALEEAIDRAGGYAAGSTKVLLGREELRVLVSDERLATAEAAARDAAAARIVATAQAVIGSDPEYPAIRHLTIEFLHPPSAREARPCAHTEATREYARDGTGDFARCDR